MKRLYSFSRIDTSVVPKDKLDFQKKLMEDHCKSELKDEAVKEGIVKYTITELFGWVWQTNHTNPMIELTVVLQEEMDE